MTTATAPTPAALDADAAVYLTHWSPSSRRNRMTATFMSAVPLTGVLGGPVSTWIMKSLAGVHELWGGGNGCFIAAALIVGTFKKAPPGPQPYLHLGLNSRRRGKVAADGLAHRSTHPNTRTSMGLSPRIKNMESEPIYAEQAT